MKSWFFNRTGVRSTLVGSLSLLLATASAQTYNYTGAAQTFTVPTGQANRVTIRVWGGGGGGGTRTTGNNNAGGGGGGGAYSQVNITLQPGNYTINVGGAGTSGNNGDASSFTVSPGFNITANGGSSGSGFSATGGGGGAAQNGFVTLGWALGGATSITVNDGGDGENGNTTATVYGGGGGAAAGVGGDGNDGSGRTHGNANGNGTGNGANGGAAGTGIGANGGDGANTTTNATAGGVPGGGGGGGYRVNGANSRAGQAGGNGRVEVTILQVLPVTFESVAATTGGNDLLVNFTTLSENNNDHFNIQASENGTDFETIATVKSKHAGAVFTGTTTYAVRIDKSGNTVLLGLSALAVVALAFGGARRNRKVFMSAVLGYVLIGMAAVSCNKNSTEIVPEEGNQKAYIRIAQVDADGHSTYSKVVAVVKN
ncbi:hypothetical protein LQ567_24635 [Niabella pedocola]|uniref:Glycine-rich domain-containing protein n=1 Tax=Niabella pedocola TaxID=1752077 RepID=A0ABS8PY49_9BACT|nr:hypothetical protein [Niabella pedocola]MCD2425994.1 hypothetical protein [Niabella pedocola]